MAESSQSGRSGEGGSGGIVARPLWITSPARSCSSRRFRGTWGLPINKKTSRPNTGTKKINSSQAMAEDGRRRSGTSPRTTTLIKMTQAQTSSVAITAVTGFEYVQPA